MKKIITANEEFGEFLRGNFVYIGDDTFYIYSYEVNMNRFYMMGTDETQNQERYLYMYELLLEIKQSDDELYHKFINEFPEYFI